MGWAEDARRRAARGGGSIPGGVPAAMRRAMGIQGPDTGAIRDRFGAPLQVGDLILYRPPYDLVFQVVAIDPAVSVDPTRPPSPSSAVMVLEIQVPLQVPRNQPLSNVVVVGHLDPPAEQPGGEKLVPVANQGGMGGMGTGPGGAERDGQTATDPGTGAVAIGDTSTVPPDHPAGDLPPAASTRPQPDRETDPVAPGGGPGPETLG